MVQEVTVQEVSLYHSYTACDTNSCVHLSVQLPPGSSSIEHEVELGVIIGKAGSSIVESQVVDDYIAGYVLALDMTDRDRQNKAKKSGLPYTLSKGFDTSCPVSQFINKSLITDPQNVNLWLKVNGSIRQRANTADMFFTIPYLISWLSKYMSLEPGDLILTGTPPGCGPVKAGDSIECGIEGVTNMRFDVVSPN